MAKHIISEEFKRMQKLAGLLNENEDNKVNQAAEKVANNPKVQDKLEDVLSKLTPEQIAQLEKDIQNTISKLETQPEITTEGDENKIEKTADTIELVASGLTKSLLIPILPVAIGSVVGSVAVGFGITGLGIAALYGIAKAIKNIK